MYTHRYKLIYINNPNTKKRSLPKIIQENDAEKERRANEMRPCPKQKQESPNNRWGINEERKKRGEKKKRDIKEKARKGKRRDK